MSALAEYVRDHTDRDACKCGRCTAPGPGPVIYLHGNIPADKTLEGETVDMVFFQVAAKNDPDAETLKRLVEAHQGEFGSMNPFDGNEHSYIEIGGWVGDQSLALQLMALGKLLGLWEILTPKMLPGLPDDLVWQMAGSGLVSLVPKRGGNMQADKKSALQPE